MRIFAVLALAVLLVACGVGVAWAHGDPASDFLRGHSVFLPPSAEMDKDVVSGLETVVEDAQERDFEIRVAVIAQPYDLGSVFQLYRKPQRYAEFLGRELSSHEYRGRVLVAMPNGFGYAEAGQANPGLAETLAGLPQQRGRDPARLAEAATRAVRQLATAAGRPLPPPELDDGTSETRDRVVIAAAAAIGVALIAGVVLLRRLRFQRRETV